MDLTDSERAWLAMKPKLTRPEIDLLHHMIGDMLYRAVHVHKIPLVLDERLTALEAAGIRYLIQSRQTPPITI